MKTSKISIILVLVVVVMVTICYATWWSHKENSPDCYSDLTKQTVKKLASTEFSNRFEQVTGNKIPESTQFFIENIRIQGHNQEIDSLLCAATLVATNNGETMKGPIFFTVEKLENFGEFYYTVVFGG